MSFAHTELKEEPKVEKEEKKEPSKYDTFVEKNAFVKQLKDKFNFNPM